MSNVYTVRYGLVPATTIIGWRGDEEAHCGPCGWEVYHEDATGSMLGVTDGTGQPVEPIYAADRHDADVFCVECGELIARAWWSPTEWRTAALTSPEYEVPAEVLCETN